MSIRVEKLAGRRETIRVYADYVTVTAEHTGGYGGGEAWQVRVSPPLLDELVQSFKITAPPRQCEVILCAIAHGITEAVKDSDE